MASNRRAVVAFIFGIFLTLLFTSTDVISTAILITKDKPHDDTPVYLSPKAAQQRRWRHQQNELKQERLRAQQQKQKELQRKHNGGVALDDDDDEHTEQKGQAKTKDQDHHGHEAAKTSLKREASAQALHNEPRGRGSTPPPPPVNKKGNYRVSTSTRDGVRTGDGDGVSPVFAAAKHQQQRQQGKAGEEQQQHVRQGAGGGDHAGASTANKTSEEEEDHGYDLADLELQQPTVAERRNDQRRRARMLLQWRRKNNAAPLTDTSSPGGSKLLLSRASQLHTEFYGAKANTPVPCPADPSIPNLKVCHDPPADPEHMLEGTCATTQLFGAGMGPVAAATLERMNLRDAVEADETVPASNATLSAPEEPTIDRTSSFITAVEKLPSESKEERWMRRSRWMFNEFHPFLKSGSCSPISTSTRETAVQARSKSPSDYTKAEREATAEVEFLASAGRTIRKLRRNKAIAPRRTAFRLRNVCFSAEGGGMSGYFPANAPPPDLPAVISPNGTLEDDVGYHFTSLVDERRKMIRNGLFIRRRKNPPRCIVKDTAVLVRPVLYQSDNLGHVIFRTAGTAHYAHHMRDQQGVNQTVVAFLVAPSAQTTFGPENAHRMFYQAMARPWFSLMAGGHGHGQPNRPWVQRASDVCFKHVNIAWTHMPMYPVNTPRGLREQPRTMRSIRQLAYRLHMCGSTVAGNAAPKPLQIVKGNGNDGETKEGKDKTKESNRDHKDKDDEDHHDDQDHGAKESKSEKAPEKSEKSSEKQRTSSGGSTAMEGTKSSKSATSRRNVLFIRRKRRRIIGAETHIKRLAKLHSNVSFTTAEFAGLSLQQQETLASTADVIIGAHGTALQWILAASPGAVLVEVQYQGHSCAEPGVSMPTSRFCEFGQTALAVGAHHLAWRAPIDATQNCHPGGRALCDVAVTGEQFDQIFDLALCLVGRPANRGVVKECAPAHNTLFPDLAAALNKELQQKERDLAAHKEKLAGKSSKKQVNSKPMSHHDRDEKAKHHDDDATTGAKSAKDKDKDSSAKLRKAKAALEAAAAKRRAAHRNDDGDAATERKPLEDD